MYRIETSSKVFAGFELSCGISIPLRLAYQWVVPEGRIRRRVLLCHGITSSHHAFLPDGEAPGCADAGWGNAFIGPGKALDPGQGDMVLCINTLGSWFGSTGAGDYLPGTFPAVTMRDMALAQWQLVDQLSITAFDQVVGYSFGGYLAVEMARQRPHGLGALLHLASGFRGRADPQGVAAIESMIRMPPDERKQAVISWRRALLERYGYVRWLQHQFGDGAAQRLDAEVAAWAATVSLEALLTLRAAAAAFDRRDAKLPVPVIAMRWDSDVLFPPWQPGEAPACQTLTCHSPYGHFAPLAQPQDWTSYLV